MQKYRERLVNSKHLNVHSLVMNQRGFALTVTKIDFTIPDVEGRVTTNYYSNSSCISIRN